MNYLLERIFASYLLVINVFSFVYILETTEPQGQCMYLDVVPGSPQQEEYLNMEGLHKQEPVTQEEYLPMNQVTRLEASETRQEEYLNMDGLKAQHGAAQGQEAQEDYENVQALHEQLKAGKSGTNGKPVKPRKPVFPEREKAEKPSRLGNIRALLEQQVPTTSPADDGKPRHDYYNQPKGKGYYNVFADKK